MSTHKRSPGTELLMVPLCGRNCLGERVPQALNITATYEGRLKCKKMIAFFPHSPIRKLSWKKKKSVQCCNFRSDWVRYHPVHLPRMSGYINSSTGLTDLTSYKPEITSTEVSKACIA